VGAIDPKHRREYDEWAFDAKSPQADRARSNDVIQAVFERVWPDGDRGRIAPEDLIASDRPGNIDAAPAVSERLRRSFEAF
jgi:hypothetical protein